MHYLNPNKKNDELYKINKMDLQTRKISFVQKFLKIQSEEVVVRMEKALKREKKNISGTAVRPMTMKELNKRVDQSLLDSENDKLTENNELTKEIQEWI